MAAHNSLADMLEAKRQLEAITKAAPEYKEAAALLAKLDEHIKRERANKAING